jgi:hypothetical protein
VQASLAYFMFNFCTNPKVYKEGPQETALYDIKYRHLHAISYKKIIRVVAPVLTKLEVLKVEGENRAF